MCVPRREKKPSRIPINTFLTQQHPFPGAFGLLSRLVLYAVHSSPKAASPESHVSRRSCDSRHPSTPQYIYVKFAGRQSVSRSPLWVGYFFVDGRKTGAWRHLICEAFYDGAALFDFWHDVGCRRAWPLGRVVASMVGKLNGTDGGYTFGHWWRRILGQKSKTNSSFNRKKGSSLDMIVSGKIW